MLKRQPFFQNRGHSFFASEDGALLISEVQSPPPPVYQINVPACCSCYSCSFPGDHLAPPPPHLSLLLLLQRRRRPCCELGGRAPRLALLAAPERRQAPRERGLPNIPTPPGCYSLGIACGPREARGLLEDENGPGDVVGRALDLVRRQPQELGSAVREAQGQIRAATAAAATVLQARAAGHDAAHEIGHGRLHSGKHIPPAAALPGGTADGARKRTTMQVTAGTAKQEEEEEGWRGFSCSSSGS